jgi:hypothetical protein
MPSNFNERAFKARIDGAMTQVRNAFRACRQLCADKSAKTNACTLTTRDLLQTRLAATTTTHHDHHTRPPHTTLSALQVKRILDTTRNPTYPADVQHEYRDKFLLAEFVTETALASVLHSLQKLGLSDTALARAFAWQRKDRRAVTLRVNAFEQCTFLRKETREVESKTQNETRVAGVFKFRSKSTFARLHTDLVLLAGIRYAMKEY